MKHNLLTFKIKKVARSPTRKPKKPQTARLPTGFGRRANGLSTGLAASVKNEKLADKINKSRLTSSYVSPRDLVKKPEISMEPTTMTLRPVFTHTRPDSKRSREDNLDIPNANEEIGTALIPDT